jgi:hypothetical protein
LSASPLPCSETNLCCLAVKSLEEWSEDEVKTWLAAEGFGLKAACIGKRFSLRTKEDMLRRDPTDGDDIFNAKELLRTGRSTPLSRKCTALQLLFNQSFNQFSINFQALFKHSASTLQPLFNH